MTNKELHLKQKETPDLSLERNTIRKAQYDKSIGDLTEKTGSKESVSHDK